MPMETVSYGNDTIRFLSRKGLFWSPRFSEEALTFTDDFPLRADDILLCSYPKSGCHWVWEIIRILLSGKISSDDGKVIEKEAFMMEFRPYQEYALFPSPRILNNHLPFDLMPRDLLVKKPKVVFMYRNFKDVVVSYFYHHKGIKEYEYNGDFESYLLNSVTDKSDNGSPFEYIRGWEKGIDENPDLSVFISSYEDFKENNLSEVKRLSHFLDKDYSDEFLEQVCDFTSFDNMRKIKGAISGKGKDGTPVMYRKGQVGDWKNHFTVALNEWFDEVIKRETAGTKLKFRYTL